MVMMLKESVFVVEVLADMGITVECVPAVTDSKSAKDIICNPGVTKHTAHFARWLHWAREECLAGRVKVYLCGTEVMWGDNMTKAVDQAKGIACRAEQLNLPWGK